MRVGWYQAQQGSLFFSSPDAPGAAEGEVLGQLPLYLHLLLQMVGTSRATLKWKEIVWGSYLGVNTKESCLSVICSYSWEYGPAWRDDINEGQQYRIGMCIIQNTSEKEEWNNKFLTLNWNRIEEKGRRKRMQEHLEEKFRNIEKEIEW